MGQILNIWKFGLHNWIPRAKISLTANFRLFIPFPWGIMRCRFYRGIILGQLLLRSRDFTSAIVTPEQIVFRPCFLYEFSSASNFLSSDTKYGHIWTFYFFPTIVTSYRKWRHFRSVTKKPLSIKITLMVHRINTRNKKSDPSLG